MHARTGWFKASSLQGAAVLALALAVAVATGLAQLSGSLPAWQSDSPVHYTSDLAVATGLGWVLFQLALNRAPGRERSRWLLALWAMVLLGAVQASDWLVGSGFMIDDWLVDLPLWAAATAMLRAVLRRGRQRPGALALWRAGMLLQWLFVLCDLAEGKSIDAWSVSAQDLASVAEWCELLAIECYVVSLVLLCGANPAGAAALPRPPLATGAEARRIFEQAHLFRAANYPPFRWATWPGIHAVLLVAGSIGLVAVLGLRVRRASGRSLHAQFWDLLALGLGQGLDPLSYYFQELYRDGGRAEAAHYLTRGETKNGLLHALNAMRRPPYPPGEMKDKVLFAACCRRAGLAVPHTLVHGGGNEPWAVDVPRAALDSDLFCKLRSGRGARGAQAFRRIAPYRYTDGEGRELDLDALVARIQASGQGAALIVQPRLRNHPELADLADQSLVTVRVLTCLDPGSGPVVTHAFLRILSKLEPDWHRPDEYGIPIDLETGRLGALASDRLASCALRFSHHPVTGQPVEGRVLHTWPAIRALALAAHRAFAHRVLVGWDIAVTAEGPVLLEGNVNLDVMFPQRVHRQAIGRSALGPLLQQHLAALARSKGVD